jgi:hypothetical protein
VRDLRETEKLTARENGRGLPEANGRPRFTWEREEYASCSHRNSGPVVALKADGAELAFCLRCNRLLCRKPGASKYQVVQHRG